MKKLPGLLAPTASDSRLNECSKKPAVSNCCTLSVRDALGVWVTLMVGLVYANFALAQHAFEQEAVVRDATAEVTTRVVTGPVRSGIYRSTGPDGEVLFNNFGDGQRITVDVRPAPGGEQERSAARTSAMLALAQVLANDREARSAKRNARRIARAAAARASARTGQRTDTYTTDRSSYFPGFAPRFLPRRGRALRRPNRSGAGPYRDGYRLSNAPHRLPHRQHANASKRGSPQQKRSL